MRKVQSLCGQRRSTDRVPIQVRALFWCPVVLHSHAPNRSYVKRALLKRHAFRLFFFFLSTGSLQVFHGFRLAWYSNPTCSSNDHPSLRQSTERKQVFLWLSCDELTSPYSTVPVKKKTFMQQIRIAQVYLISPPPSSCSVDCHRTICIF